MSTFVPSTHAAAKRIILGIIRENGRSFNGRTRLYKAFYDAHLFCWRKYGKYLTTHPIVRMPNGPGIDDGSLILQSLVNEGALKHDSKPVGPYREDAYTLCTDPSPPLTEQEMDSIASALEWVEDKSATEISRESHERSWTWRNTQPGHEQHVYLDTLTEEALERKQVAARAIKELWGATTAESAVNPQRAVG